MNPLSWDYLLSPSTRAASSYLPPLTPQEEESLVSQVLGKSIGALEMAGNLLDVPGSMVRDALALQNPFDQLLSPLSGDNRTSGRDLLTQYGLAAENDPTRWEFADIGGFAAEVALDPTTYMTFGGSALSKAGQAVKKAGLLDDVPKVAAANLQKAVGKREARAVTTVEDLLNPLISPNAESAAKKLQDAGLDINDPNIRQQKIGGVAGIGLPFMEPSFTVGGGDMGRKALQGMDATGEYLAGTTPGRYFRGVFDRTAGNTFNRNLQKVMPDAVAETDKAKFDQILDEADWIKRYGDEANNVDAISLSVEKADELDAALAAGKGEEFFRKRGVTPLSENGIKLSRELSTKQAEVFAELQSVVGTDMAKSLMSEQMNYFSRFRTEAIRPDKADDGFRQSKVLGLKADSLKARTAPENVVTSVLNKVSVDPAIAGESRTLKNVDAAAEHILKTNYDLAGDTSPKQIKSAWDKVNGTSQFTRQLQRRGPVFDAVKRAVDSVNQEFGTDYSMDVVSKYLDDVLKQDAEVAKSQGLADVYDQFIGEFVKSGPGRASFFKTIGNVFDRIGGDIRHPSLQKYGMDWMVQRLRDAPEYSVLLGGRSADDAEAALVDILTKYRAPGSLKKAERSLNRVPADDKWVREKLVTYANGTYGPDRYLDDLQTSKATNPPTPEEVELAKRFDKAKEVAEWASARPDSYVQAKTPTFGNTAAEDFARSTAGLRVVKANGNAIQQMFSDVATPDGSGAVMSYRDALSAVGFKPALDAEGNVVDDLAADYANQLLQQKGKPGNVDRLFVPVADVEAAQKSIQRLTAPETVTGLMKNYDDLIRGTKLGLTFAPSFHGRNFIGGVTQNILSGLWRDPLSGTKSMKEFRGFMAGKEIPKLEETVPLFQGMTNAEANAEFRKLVSATGLYRNQADDVGATVSSPASVFGGDTPLERWQAKQPGPNNPLTMVGVLGEFGSGLKRIGKEAMSGKFPRELNPLNTAGIGSQKADDFVLSKLQRQTGNWVEGQLRGSALLEQLKQGVDARQAVQNINAAHVDYGKATDVERQVLKRLFPFYCVPESHEMLTKRGWVHWRDLVIGEPVMSMDHSTGDMEWVPLEAVSTYDYDDDLLLFTRKQGSVRFLFTDDHRWPVVTTRTSKVVAGERVRPSGFYCRKFVTGERLSQSDHYHILCAGEFRGEESILSPRLAAILGWVVTDGYSRWVGNSCEMVVYQHPKKYLSEIVDLLGTGHRQRSPHPVSGVVCVPVAREDINEITRVFRSRDDLMGIVCRLSRDAMDAMKEAMFMAEGSTNPVTGQRHFAQFDSRISDAFQFLCTLTGEAANISKSGCYIKTKTTYTPGRDGGLQRERYKGVIWCPQTRHGTWVMRNGGAVVITGNSFSRGISEYVGRELMERPGGRTAQAIRATNSGRSDDNYVPDYVSEGTAISMQGLPEWLGGKEGRYLSGFGLMHEAPFELAAASPTVSGTIQRTAQKLASNLAPPIRGSIELATGQNLYTGRPQRELYQFPFSGETEAGRMANLVLGNSPLSRQINTTRKLIDDRKGALPKAVNFFTGTNVMDLSGGVERAKEFAASKAAEEMLKQSPRVKTYENLYVPEDVRGDLTPVEIDLLRLKKSQAKKAKQAAKERAAQGT